MVARWHLAKAISSLDLKSVSEHACVRSKGKLFHKWAPYSLNDKHLYCHDMQILISDNLVSYHVKFYTLLSQLTVTGKDNYQLNKAKW